MCDAGLLTFETELAAVQLRREEKQQCAGDDLRGDQRLIPFGPYSR
jgi:hypothetical protein